MVFFAFGMMVLTNSCHKSEPNKYDHSVVEIYLVDHFQTTHGMQIDDASVVISGEPFISFDQITGYKPSGCTFFFSKSVADSLSHFDTNGLLRKAFAVTVDKEVIYPGYFWAAFFSSMCDWYIIDLVEYTDSNPLSFSVQLGYPAELLQDSIPDNRNSERLIGTFRAAGKIVE